MQQALRTRQPADQRAAKPDAPPARRISTGHFDKASDYRHDRTEGIYDWLIILTVRGAGVIRWTDGRTVVREGEVILFEPDAPHGYGTDPAVGQWEILWAHFEPPPSWRPCLDWPTLGHGVRHLSINDAAVRTRVEHHLAEANRLFASYMPHHRELALNALEAAILWCDQQNPASAFARLDPRMRQALDVIAGRLHEPITLADVAQAVNLSESRFAHLFREELGQTPQRFIEQQRIERAQQLLERSSLTIADIAQAVGFQNPFYFTLRFKKATGTSPRAYRHAHP